MEQLINKLNRASEVWKAQFDPPYNRYPPHWPNDPKPDIPLIWHVEDGMLMLDDVWICPVKYINQERLEDAARWFHPIAIQIDLTDGFVDVYITKSRSGHAIASVERVIRSKK